MVLGRIDSCGKSDGTWAFALTQAKPITVATIVPIYRILFVFIGILFLSPIVVSAT